MAVISRMELVPAYLLHQRPYRESSALLEMFTESHGRVGLVARGVRSPKSRRRGELQPFRSLRLSWQARGELGTLTGVEADGPLHSFNGTALYSAFYLNELLLRLLARHDPHPGLYTVYQASLQHFSHGLEVEPVLRLFEKRLLQELGYGLLLDYEITTGEPVQPEFFYDYQLESGPVITHGEAAQGFVFKGSSLLALSQETLATADVLRDAKRLMRAALNLYLGNKPLKSRELFRSLKKSREKQV
ncbi:MAG: DNA repair protein RecO [Thiogranum sp.]|jgi:DNA repair protein RecO (recombination protein O)